MFEALFQLRGFGGFGPCCCVWSLGGSKVLYWCYDLVAAREHGRLGVGAEVVVRDRTEMYAPCYNIHVPCPHETL